MGKSNVKKRKKGKNNQSLIRLHKDRGIGTDVIYSIYSKQPFTEKQLEELTEIYREKIRESPLWDEFVRIYGIEGAENALEECSVKNIENFERG